MSPEKQQRETELQAGSSNFLHTQKLKIGFPVEGEADTINLSTSLSRRHIGGKQSRPVAGLSFLFIPYQRVSAPRRLSLHVERVTSGLLGLG